MTRKRSFSVTINLETNDDNVDLAYEETYVFEELKAQLEDPAFSEHVAYVSREGESTEWSE
jgi:hypothetical protein